MYKLTINYKNDVGGAITAPRVCVEMEYDDDPLIRTCTFEWNEPWDGWEWVDGDSEPNMSDDMRDFFHGDGGNKLLDIVAEYHVNVSVEV